MMNLLQGTKYSVKDIFKPSMSEQTDLSFQGNPSIDFSKNPQIKDRLKEENDITWEED